MSFFNLTMLGYQNQIKDYKTKDDSFLPPIKPLDSNIKFLELRTKHIRNPKGMLKRAFYFIC